MLNTFFAFLWDKIIYPTRVSDFIFGKSGI